MLSLLVTLSMLVGAAAQLQCSQELLINDFNRNPTPMPRWSNIGELYSDDGSISERGTYEITNTGKLHIVTPSDASSYWFFEFNPLCLSVTSYSHLQFELQMSVDTSTVMAMTSADPTGLCGNANFAQSRLPLSRYASAGASQIVQVPLVDWETGAGAPAAFVTTRELHSFVLEFPAGVADFVIDNIKLVGSCSGQVVTPAPTPVTAPRATVAPQATGTPQTQVTPTSTTPPPTQQDQNGAETPTESSSVKTAVSFISLLALAVMV